MTEIKVTISAPELSEAINALARALDHSHGRECGDTCKAETAPAVAPTVPTQEPTNAAPASAPVAPAPITATVPAPAQTVVPTSAPTYTLEAIARAGTALLDAGKMSELTELLKKYGADTLVTINPTYYGAVAADLRALGAQI